MVHGTMYSCFMIIVCFTKMRLIVVMLTNARVMLSNTCLSASICCRSSWRRHCLLWLGPQWQVPAVGWTGVGVPPPSRSSCHSIEKCNHKLLLVCFLQYSIYCSLLYIPYTVLNHVNIPNHNMFHKTRPLLWRSRSISHPAIQNMWYGNVIWYSTVNTLHSRK